MPRRAAKTAVQRVINDLETEVKSASGRELNILAINYYIKKVNLPIPVSVNFELLHCPNKLISSLNIERQQIFQRQKVNRVYNNTRFKY